MSFIVVKFFSILFVTLVCYLPFSTFFEWTCNISESSLLALNAISLSQMNFLLTQMLPLNMIRLFELGEIFFYRAYSLHIRLFVHLVHVLSKIEIQSHCIQPRHFTTVRALRKMGKFTKCDEKHYKETAFKSFLPYAHDANHTGTPLSLCA